jgi:hypothetical protein
MLILYLPWRRYFFRLSGSLLGLLFFIGGCAYAPVTGLTTKRKHVSVEELLSSIRQRNDQINSLRTITRLTIATPVEQKSFSAVLLVQRPHFIRLEALNMFMQPLHFFVLNEQGLLWYTPADKKAVIGDANSLNIYRLLGIRVTVAELVDILLGCTPLPPSGDIKPQLTYLNTEHNYLLRFCSANNLCSHEILLHPYWFYAEKMLHAAGPTATWRVDWGNYQQLADIQLPTDIKMERMDESSRIELQYDKPVINEAITQDKFQLELPPGLEVVLLENH